MIESRYARIAKVDKLDLVDHHLEDRRESFIAEPASEQDITSTKGHFKAETCKLIEPMMQDSNDARFDQL